MHYVNCIFVNENANSKFLGSFGQGFARDVESPTFKAS